MHLTETSYAALLSGGLPPAEARELAAHLAGECERCERFLAERGAADRLDGAADAAIAASLPPRDGRGDDLEFARIRRALRQGAGRRLLVPGAVAASLLVLGVVGLAARELREHRPPEGPAWDGSKGLDARPAPVRLRLLRMAADGSVEKGLSGEPVDRSASLLFELETGRDSQVALARVGEGGGVEILWRGRVGTGRTQVTVDGRPAAYPLAALTGLQRFVLLAAEAGLDEPRAIRAAEPLAPPAPIRPDHPALDGLSLDVVEVPLR